MRQARDRSEGRRMEPPKVGDADLELLTASGMRTRSPLHFHRRLPPRGRFRITRIPSLVPLELANLRLLHLLHLHLLLRELEQNHSQVIAQ